MFQFGITVLSLYKLVKIQGKIYSKHRVRIKIKGPKPKVGVCEKCDRK